MICRIRSEVSDEIEAMLALNIHKLSQLLLIYSPILPKEQMQEPQH